MDKRYAMHVSERTSSPLKMLTFPNSLLLQMLPQSPGL